MAINAKMTRHETYQDFNCARCAIVTPKKNPKRAKNVAVAPNGDKLCNGCYGWLVAAMKDWPS